MHDATKEWQAIADTVPAQLRDRRQWVLHDPKKMPLTTAGAPASSTDPTTWATLAECILHANGYAGFGFVFSADDPFVGIDLDGCRDPETGEIEPWAHEIIVMADSYTEISPSQAGVKIWVRGCWPHGGRKKNMPSDGEVLPKKPAIEVYPDGRYFTFTGQQLTSAPNEVEERQRALNWLWAKHFEPKVEPAPASAPPSSYGQADDRIIERARKYVARMPDAVEGQGGDDATYDVALVLMRGFGLSEGDAWPIYWDYNQGRCHPPWTEQRLRRNLRRASQAPLPMGYIRDANSSTWDAGQHRTLKQTYGLKREAAIETDDEAEKRQPIRPLNLVDFIDQNPALDEPLIDGLLRRGEVGNIIAASKVGKSWFGYGLGYAAATGAEWLGQFPCKPCRVVLIDNELRAATLANRLKTVAAALEVDPLDIRDQFLPVSLRGQLKSVYDIGAMIEDWGQFDLIIFDAFYRGLPDGVDENSNTQITAIYNHLDYLCERQNAAWVNIHHSSKGNQATKSVVDMGSGAGAQSRAADCHLVLREHEDPAVAVLDAAVRSFAPIDPLSIRWDFPLWIPDSRADASAIKGRLSRAEERRQEADREKRDEILETLHKDGPQVSRSIRAAIGVGADRVERLLRDLVKEGRVTRTKITVKGNDAFRYELTGDDTSHEGGMVQWSDHF